MSFDYDIRMMDTVLRIMMMGERAARERIGSIGWEEFMSWFLKTEHLSAGIKPKLVSEDDCGKLWKLDVTRRDIYVVEVENSTPEPDGSRKHYFIPVDRWMRPIRQRRTIDVDGVERLVNVLRRLPQRKTARNAVASTFGLYGWQWKRIIAS